MTVTDKTLMWFGKHKGVKMANVPANYLLHLYEENICYGELKDYIEDNLEVLKQEIGGDECDATEIDLY